MRPPGSRPVSMGSIGGQSTGSARLLGAPGDQTPGTAGRAVAVLLATAHRSIAEIFPTTIVDASFRTVIRKRPSGRQVKPVISTSGSLSCTVWAARAPAAVQSTGLVLRAPTPEFAPLSAVSCTLSFVNRMLPP